MFELSLTEVILTGVAILIAGFAMIAIKYGGLDKVSSWMMAIAAIVSVFYAVDTQDFIVGVIATLILTAMAATVVRNNHQAPE